MIFAISTMVFACVFFGGVWIGFVYGNHNGRTKAYKDCADTMEKTKKNHAIRLTALRKYRDDWKTAANEYQQRLNDNSTDIQTHFASMRMKCKDLMNMMSVTVDGKEISDGGDRDEDESEGSRIQMSLL